MLILGPNWKKHRTWAYGILLLSIATTVFYLIVLNQHESWPTGSHPLCFTYGVIGAALILFEALLWLRKKLRLWRIGGSPKSWMVAHIWLGLFTVPMALLHSGFYLGGVLTMLLMAIYFSVIFSGIVGLWLQQIIPPKLLHEVPNETIFSQIDRIVFFIRHDAERLIQTVNADFEFPAIENDPLIADQEAVEELKDEVLRHGAARGGQSIATSMKTLTAPSFTRKLISEKHPIVLFCEEFLPNFLSVKNFRQSPLLNKKTFVQLFESLRRETDREHLEMVDQLEELCRQRHDLFFQNKLQWFLHIWLLVHSPLTIMLLGLLSLHIFYGLYYW